MGVAILFLTMTEASEPTGKPSKPPSADVESSARTRRRGEVGFHFRDALRLLFILVEGAEAGGATEATTGLPVFIGEKRLMAIDFLVRYPDYLANSLLDLFEVGRDPKILATVRTIFDTNEPDVRVVRMVRWRRGAFQNIETALSILHSRRLVRTMKKSLGGDRYQHEFVIGEQATAFIDEAMRDQPTLAWYRDRARLAMLVAGDRSGTNLKDEQYEQEEYRDATFGSFIPSIKDRVLARLSSLEAAK